MRGFKGSLKQSPSHHVDGSRCFADSQTPSLVQIPLQVRYCATLDKIFPTANESFFACVFFFNFSNSVFFNFIAVEKKQKNVFISDAFLFFSTAHISRTSATLCFCYVAASKRSAAQSSCVLFHLFALDTI